MAGEFLDNVLSGQSFALFDGAMGTMLVRAGLEAGELPDLLCLNQPQTVTSIHRGYVEAGSQFVTTNTFGASRRKLAGYASVQDVYSAAVACAREAGPKCVVGDIGPLGELMAPMGKLSFAEAYDMFAEEAQAAQSAGADAIIVETMADTIEMAAALMAVKASCDLPVFATMTFMESGRTFLGSEPVAASLALWALGADVIGVNCSAGPEDLAPVVRAMLQTVPCPVIMQANAGLPQVVDGETVYAMGPQDYVRTVAPLIDDGITVLGGCCGTDPDFIRGLADLVEGREVVTRAVSVEDCWRKAHELAEGRGRDAQLLSLILEASNTASLKHDLEEEYGLD